MAAFGLVAQLVEQRTENPCVGGSIPPRATFKTLLNRGVFWLHQFSQFSPHLVMFIPIRDTEIRDTVLIQPFYPKNST